MAQRQAMREREPEPDIPIYEQTLRERARLREQLANGQVVVKGKERPWRNDRQGRHLHLFWPGNWDKVCAPNWRMFVKDIDTTAEGITTSGEHRHQGGLGLFVIEGEGWTVVDDVRYPWKAGDFIMLPIKPQGCVHQHFAKPGTNAKWVAIIWEPLTVLVGAELEHRQVSPLVASGEV